MMLARPVVLCCLPVVFALACDSSTESGPRPPSSRGADAAPSADAPPAPTGECAGTAAVCDSFDLSLATTCEGQQGCVAERRCRPAFGFSCFSLVAPTECERVGCTWAAECGGPGVCFLETTPQACAASDGCHWDEFCDPLSNPSDAYCGPLEEQSCVGDQACEWGYLTCSGDATTCPELTDEDDCAAQQGCGWTPFEE